MKNRSPSPEPIKQRRKKRKKKKKKVDSSFSGVLYNTGYYLGIAIFLPLLLGFCVNLVLTFLQKRNISYPEESVHVTTIEGVVNSTWSIPLYCPDDISDDVPIYVLFTDIGGNQMSFPKELRDKSCIFSRDLKGFNKLKRKLADQDEDSEEDEKKEEKSEEEEKIASFNNRFVNAQEKVLEHISEKYNNRKLVLVGHGLGSNFAFIHIGNELVEKAILMNPFPLDNDHIRSYFRKNIMGSLFFSLVGWCRLFPVVNAMWKIGGLLGVQEVDIRGISSISEEDSKEFFQSHFCWQSHWEGAKMEMENFDQLKVVMDGVMKSAVGKVEIFLSQEFVLGEKLGWYGEEVDSKEEEGGKSIFSEVEKITVINDATHVSLPNRLIGNF